MNQIARTAFVLVVALAAGCLPSASQSGRLAPGVPGGEERPPAARRSPEQRAHDECSRRVTLALELKGESRAPEAERAFAAILRDLPTCAAAYVNLAILERARGALQDARRNVRRALAIDAQLLPAFNELALLYLAEAQSERQLDLAEVVCSQAQKIDGDFAAIYNTWGLIDLRRDRITAAAQKFRRAAELDPTMFAAHMNFGRVALAFRGYGDARVAFERALALSPDSFDALIGLGVALRGQGELEAAEARYKEALARDPARPEPDFNLGILYQDFRQGSADDMKRARAHFERFLEKVGDRQEYATAVDDVKRRCAQRTRHPYRRRGERCTVGRLQTIEQYIEALEQ